MTLPNITQTKYWLAVAAFLIASVALCALKLCTFTEWATFVLALFGLYGSADVVNTHLQQSKGIPAERQTS